MFNQIDKYDFSTSPGISLYRPKFLDFSLNSLSNAAASSERKDVMINGEIENHTKLLNIKYLT